MNAGASANGETSKKELDDAAMKLAISKFFAIVFALGLAMLAGPTEAAICQFNQASGAWNVPANWNNCSGGNGIPAGTPGPADRAEITAATVILPAGTFSVGDIYIGNATIQGAGIANTTLNVVAAGTIAWASGSYTFNQLRVNFSSSMAIPALSGPLIVNTAELKLMAPSTQMQADAVTVTGAGAKFTNEGIFTPSTSVTMTMGGVFENSPGAVFNVSAPITVAGPFQNKGSIFIAPGPLTLSSAAQFSMSGSSASINGTGSVVAVGQTLTLSSGFVNGTPTFNVGTLLNDGATIRPGGPGAIGTITINGNFQQVKVSAMQQGSVEFDLAMIGNVDQLLVSGAVTLGGNLGRGAVGTFAPPVGTVLDVITAGSVSGSFDGGSELIVFDAPRRYVEVISATQVSLRANETVWVVGDPGDAASGFPTLRAALTAFNNESGASCANAPYSIHFGLPLGNTTIAPGSALPAITGCPALFIDGYTQPNAIPNSSMTDWNAVLPVSLDGSGCGGCTGLQINATDTIVTGINFANWPTGVSIGSLANNTQVKGNYFFQGNFGVSYNGATGVKIGDNGNPAFRNVFVHAANVGVLLSGGTGVLVANNLIGLGAGATPGPNGFGIQVNSAINAVMSKNVIANNGKGITVNGGNRADYRDSRIFSNTIIGVDLNNDGPTPNDDAMPPYDTDTGANLLLNYPKILSVGVMSASVGVVNYEVKSTPNTSIDVYFCINPAGGSQCATIDPVSAGVTTDASGFFSGSRTLTGLNTNDVITLYAYANNGPKAGNMSEISPGVAFAAAACGNTEVTNTNDSGACSLRAAITYANANCGGGPYNITFNIIGAGGPYTIAPATELPALTCNGTVVNGYSQPGASANSVGVDVYSVMPTSLTTNLQVILNGSSLSMGRGLTVSADNVSVRGLAIRSFPYEGIFITGNNARIEGNFIGTDPGGMTAFGNGFAGIKLAGGTGTRIGGSTAQVNLITGNVFAGIQVFAPASNFQIWNNLLGGDRAGGSAISGGGNGAVEVFGNMTPTNMTGDVYSNIFHFHAGSAVWVDPLALNVTINENSMSSLGAKAININGTGNSGLAAPTLTQVTYSATSTNVIGSFTALTPGVHQLDLFSNPAQAALPIGQVYVQNFNPTASMAGATPFNFNAAANIKNLSMTVTQNGTGTSELSAIYVSPLSISPATVAPFNVTAGAAATYQTFTVTNLSGANLTFGAIPYGVPMGGYVIGTETCANATLTPMGTCSYQIGFASPMAGTFNGNAALNVTQGGVTSVFQQAVSAVAMAAGAPIFSPSATMLTFSAQTVTSTSPAQTITITNTGASALTFGMNSISGPFTISGNSCTSVAPAMTCTVSVTFSPTATGAATGSLTLNTNAAASPHLIALGGTGLAPSTTYAPASLNFGSLSQGTTSMSQQVTFTNTSPVTITLSSVSFVGGGSGFAVLGGSQCLGAPTLNSMSSCTFDITATPNAVGSLSDNVFINTTPANASTPVNVALSVIGTAPLTPTITVAFAPTSVNTGVNSTLTFTLTNPTASPAGVVLGSSVAVSGLTMSALTDSCSLGAFISTGSVDFGMAGTIPAMGTCTVTVQAQRATPGVVTVTANPGNLITTRGNNANTSGATLTVTAAPTGPYAYIPIFTSFSGSTVSVIDLPTNTLATTITVGAGPVGAAVNAAGTRAYISNQQGNSVSVIDTATNTVVATVPVGSQPGSAAVNPAGTRVYVPNQSSNSVSVIDTSSNTVVATVPGLTFPSAAAVNPSGSKVFVTLASANSIGVIDTGTNALIGTIPVCTGPYQPVVNGAGTRLYVVCTSGNVSVVDTGTGTVLATIPVGTTPRGIALTPNGAQAWTSNSGTNNVSVIDTATNTVTNTLAAGTTPWGIAGNAAGTRMYVANSGNNTVSVFDTSTNTIVATVPVGVGPVAIGQFLQPGAVASNPVLSRSQANVAFGGRTTNTTSPATVVTIGNSGTANLVISSITVSGDFGFTTTCPILAPPIAPLATCTVSITFTPLTVASLNGTLTIASNAPGSPHTIALTGTGLAVAAPAIGLSATAVNLGSIVVNTTSPQQSVIVTNTGFANLNITGITVTGTGFARVTPSTGSPVNCATSVAPSSTCQIAIACTPTALGTIMGQVSIAHNAIGSPTLVNLSCTGSTVPVATVALSSALDFGDQIVNTASAPRPVSIANTGTAPLTVSSIALSGTDANQFTQTGVCTTVAAGASCDVLVGFAPTSIGAKSAGLIVTSNAQNAQTTNRVALSGNGVLAPRPVANPSVTAIGFGNTIFGGASPMQLISFKNDGGLAMSISGVVATGDFTQMNNCGGSVASLASCNINVAFNPLAVGGRNGELQIFTNAQGSPHRIFLSGTGCRWFSQAGSRFFLTAC
jgi:YVTN family beta-propeller protein